MAHLVHISKESNFSGGVSYVVMTPYLRVKQGSQKFTQTFLVLVSRHRKKEDTFKEVINFQI
jgi:hypothetical protein